MLRENQGQSLVSMGKGLTTHFQHKRSKPP
ncbi:Uncharacterised protein [Vibrio cholerae]|nr:Uncharacterised protein [Vibrio cholerae]